MLFTQSFSRFMASFALCSLIASQLPANAQIGAETDQSVVDSGQVTETILNKVSEQENPDNDQNTNNSAPLKNGVKSNTTLIAQAGSGIGSEVADIAAAGALVGKKKKFELLITDSLWGNLILDMAYQRDPQLRKLARRVNLVNMSTMGIIAGVAGGTLAQGIISLSTLNPPAPLHDSYLPGGLGIGFAGLTLITFVGRATINHYLGKSMRNRQLELKHKVEAILADLESTHGGSSAAQNDLVRLIGERAANEWLQLWRSSNALASEKQPNLSLLPAYVLNKQHL